MKKNTEKPTEKQPTTEESYSNILCVEAKKTILGFLSSNISDEECINRVESFVDLTSSLNLKMKQMKIEITYSDLNKAMRKMKENKEKRESLTFDESEEDVEP